MGAKAGVVVLVLMCSSCVAIAQPAAPSPLPYAAPESCREAAGGIFQSGNLSCVTCPTNSESSADGLSCQCAPDTIGDAGEASSSAPQCASCGENQMTSSNGFYCVDCEDTYNCSCLSNLYIFMDTPPLLSGSPGNRTCVLCPPGTWADQSGFSCAACGLDNCSQCLEPYNGRCFPSPSSLPSPPSSPPPFTYYTQHFTEGVGLCRQGNQEACQLLINLCVLQRYSRSDPACQEVSSSSSPLLRSAFYPRHQADEILSDTALRNRLYTSPSSQGPSDLPLMAATFALNGTFLGLHNVSEQLLICGDIPPRYDAVWKVGVHYEVNYRVGVATLSMTSSEPIFYDLYWRDQSSGSDWLHPVPVVPSDYVDSETGEEVNDGEDREAWQLVTRFFLSEGISSHPRYASDITLRIQLDSDGRVFTPFLHITYAEWEPDMDSTDAIKASFSVNYTQYVMSFNITLSVCVAVMAIMVGVVCGFRVNGFVRRTGDLCCTLPTYVFMLAEYCGLLSSCLFILLSVSCFIILSLYKGQTLFVYTLPVGSQLLIFQLLLPLALICRVIHVVYLIWSQCTVDMFLLDWERPKTLTNQSSEQPSGVAPPTQYPVSIWRTYFIANEWNELQTVRRGARPHVPLFLALLLLQVAGLRYLAEQDPSGHVTRSPWRYSAPPSPLLRFAMTTLVFTVIAVSMRLYMFLVHERFVEHKLQQFIDLCSVSNVSVFIMWHRCYGYYIEGRSVHGHADVDMRQMNLDLHKEQEDLCGRRGLMPDSDLQTFQIALSRQFRMHYDRILTSLTTTISEGRGVRGGDNMPRPPTQGGRVSEASITAYEQMNHFLSSFISHNLRDMEYSIKTKVIIEKLLDVELHGPEDCSIFYEDHTPSIAQIIFYGQEWSLWQLEVLVFAFVDMLATDYVLAAIITAIVAGCVSLLRDVLGRRNVARKTLVDRRFLI